MSIEIEEVARASDADAALLELAAQLCSWRRPPGDWHGGRVGWHATTGWAHTPVRALKLKGLGRPPAPGSPASMPGAELFDRSPGQPPDPHLGIGPDGHFVLLHGDPAPVGGLTRSAAEREFRCADSLRAAGVPAVLPIAVYEYVGRGLHCGSVREPLAVSVTGSTTASPLRLGVAVPGVATTVTEQTELARIARSLGRPAPETTSTADSLAVLRAGYHAFGVTLRGFSDAGWYRYSGHPDNVVVGDDGRAILIDLDSCRAADPLADGLAALEAVRDGMSALYNLACTFFRPDVMISTSDTELIDHEPFSGFLTGWSRCVPHQAASTGRAIAEYVVRSRERLRFFAEFLAEARPRGEYLYRFVRHDRDLTFAWLFHTAFSYRYADPGVAPLPFDPDELNSRLSLFAGYERTIALRRLIADAGYERVLA